MSKATTPESADDLYSMGTQREQRPGSPIEDHHTSNEDMKSLVYNIARDLELSNPSPSSDSPLTVSI